MSDAGAVRLMSILGSKGNPIDTPEETIDTLGDDIATPEEISNTPEEIVDTAEDNIVTPENTMENFEDAGHDVFEDDEIFTTADAEMLHRLLKGKNLSSSQRTKLCLVSYG